MGWSIGYDEKWKRDIGYGVPATCDHPGCGASIDRGLSYVCGGLPYGGEHGCGLYFCDQHRMYAGDRRDNARLCAKCYWNHGGTFTPTPDTPEWVEHKATDPSWAEWRAEQEASGVAEGNCQGILSSSNVRSGTGPQSPVHAQAVDSNVESGGAVDA